ncbi:hypothetical protein HK096_008403, partial [Nowakowskiella sp. JEL0078]
MGRVSRSHFSRLLSTMKLGASDEDLHILFRKFEDGKNGYINYMEFVHAIDPETYEHLIKESIESSVASISPSKLTLFTADEIMTRLRSHARAKRIRVAEFFRDFDKLRSYSIPRHDFIRGINRIGLAMGADELEAIATKYVDMERRGFCQWKDFEKDIERVFGETRLEARPSINPKTELMETNPFVTGIKLTSGELQKLEAVLIGMREHLQIRQTSVKPFFKDFDKLCTGHVSKSQFRQCLTYMGIIVPDDEFEVLCKRWSKKSANINDNRICYLAFLKELESGFVEFDQSFAGGWEEEEGGIFAEIPADSTNSESETTVKNSSVQKNFSTDFQGVEHLLKRIKTRVKTERIRVIDLMMDFDHLRSGKITPNEFRRVLKVVFVNLTEAELTTLEKTFSSQSEPKYVEYIKFSDALESVFTKKGFEYEPTSEPEEFTDYCYENGIGSQQDFSYKNILLMKSNEISVLRNVTLRLAEKVRQKRIDLLSYLEDFDFVKE